MVAPLATLARFPGVSIPSRVRVNPEHLPLPCPLPFVLCNASFDTQQGLRKIRETGESIRVPIRVYGPETHITAVVPMALGLVDGATVPEFDQVSEQVRFYGVVWCALLRCPGKMFISACSTCFASVSGSITSAGHCCTYV